MDDTTGKRLQMRCGAGVWDLGKHEKENKKEMRFA